MFYHHPVLPMVINPDPVSMHKVKDGPLDILRSRMRGKLILDSAGECLEGQTLPLVKTEKQAVRRDIGEAVRGK